MVASWLQEKIDYIQSSKKRTRIYIGTDAIFVIFHKKTYEWGEMRRSLQHRKMRDELVVIVITSLDTYKLSTIHQVYRPHFEKIVGKIQYGSIDSMLSLYDQLGNCKTNYGIASVMLHQTRLENYL